MCYLSVPCKVTDRSNQLICPVMFFLPHYLFLFQQYLSNTVYTSSKKARHQAHILLPAS